MSKKHKVKKPKFCPFCESDELELIVASDDEEVEVHNALASYYVDMDEMQGCEYLNQWDCDNGHTFFTYEDDKEDAPKKKIVDDIDDDDDFDADITEDEIDSDDE